MTNLQNQPFFDLENDTLYAPNEQTTRESGVAYPDRWIPLEAVLDWIEEEFDLLETPHVIQ